MKPIEKIDSETSCDITEHLNLNNIKGNHNAKTLCNCLVTSLFEEKENSNIPTYPKVLLLGPTGKEAFASAIHNSLANIDFIELSGDYVCKGGDDIVDILKCSNEFDTIVITEANNLSTYAQNVIWKYLKRGEVELVDIFERRKEIINVPDITLILSTTTLEGISQSLHSLFTIVHMCPYTKYELVEILKQHCSFYRISYESDEVLEKLVERADGRSGKALKLLEWARKFSLCSHSTTISNLHVQRVLTNYGFSSFCERA